MIAQPRKIYYTFDDFMTLVKDGEKADLIDGVIYMASPDNTEANKLNMWLGGLLYDFTDLRDLGNVFTSRVAFRLDDENSPEPDIGFVRKERLHLVRRGFVDGPPDAAMEIVSPESVERDYDKKRKQFEAVGVREHWIVDEIERKTTFLRLGKNGKFREVKLRKGVFTSTAIPGFWFRPEWLWQEPRPRKTDVLTWITA
jgi:Uma2 family endonuclease